MAANLGNAVIQVRADIEELRRRLREVENLARQSGNATGQNFTRAFSAELNRFNPLQNFATSVFQGIGTRIGMSIQQGMLKVLTTPITLPIQIAQDSFRGYQQFQGFVQQYTVVAEASAQQTKDFAEEAKRLGAATSKTAADVANAGQNLAKLGFDAKGAKEALAGVVALAEATGEDMEKTATAVAVAVNSFDAFEKKQADVLKIADIFSAGINKTNLDIYRLQMGLATTGSVANSFGQSLETTVTILGLLNDSGMQAESAGTALKTSLMNLANPNKSAQDGLNELAAANNGVAISLRDSTGKFKDFMQILPQLKSAFKNLTPDRRDAVAEALFGREGITGFLTLLNRSDKEINDIFTSISKGTGSAEQAKNKLMDGLTGSLSILSSSIDTLKLNFAEAFAPGVERASKFLNEIIGELTSSKNIFNDLSQAAKDFSAYLEKNPQLVQKISSVVDKTLKQAFMSVKNVAEDILDYLDKNPRAIEETVNQMQIFLSQLVQAGELAGRLLSTLIKAGNELRIVMGGGPVIEGSRNTVESALGRDKANEFDRELEKRWLNIIQNPNSPQTTKDKVAEDLAQEMLVNQAKVNREKVEKPAQKTPIKKEEKKEAQPVSTEKTTTEQPSNKSEPETTPTESKSDSLKEQRAREDKFKEESRAQEDAILNLQLQQEKDPTRKKMLELQQGSLSNFRSIEDQRINLERSKEDLPQNQPTKTDDWINPVEKVQISSPFGERINPVTKHKENHPGLDFAGAKNTPIFSVADGKVIDSRYANDVIGNTVTVLHEDGKMSRYGHLNSLEVKKDDEVKAGQEIGKMGSTGRATGDHLHFEAYDATGNLINPETYLKGHSAQQPTASSTQEQLQEIDALLEALKNREALALETLNTQKNNFFATQNDQIKESIKTISGQLEQLDSQKPDTLENRLSDTKASFETLQNLLKEQINQLQVSKDAIAEYGASAEQIKAINEDLATANQKLIDTEKDKQQALINVTNAFNDQQKAQQAVQKEAIADVNQNIGQTNADILDRTGNPFKANNIKKAIAIDNVEARKNQALDSALERAGGDKSNPLFSQEQVSIIAQYNQELAQTGAQFSSLQLLANPIQNAFQGMFEGLFTGSKTLGEAVLGFFQSILQSIAEMAAQLASQQIIKMLFPSLFAGFTGGGGFGAGFGGGLAGGLAGIFSSGGEVKETSANYSISEALKKEGSNAVLAALTPGEQILSVKEAEIYRSSFPSGLLGVQNFAHSLNGGGEVLQKPFMAISEALKKEGSNAVLAALTPGEQVLSVKEAEIYRSSFPSGLINNDQIFNFKSGGIVGHGGGMSSPQKQQSDRVHGGISSNVNITVFTNDADSFRKSQDQIKRESALQEQRSLKRNGY